MRTRREGVCEPQKKVVLKAQINSIAGCKSSPMMSRPPVSPYFHYASIIKRNDLSLRHNQITSTDNSNHFNALHVCIVFKEIYTLGIVPPSFIRMSISWLACIRKDRQDGTISGKTLPSLHVGLRHSMLLHTLHSHTIWVCILLRLACDVLHSHAADALGL